MSASASSKNVDQNGQAQFTRCNSKESQGEDKGEISIDLSDSLHKGVEMMPRSSSSSSDYAKVDANDVDLLCPHISDEHLVVNDLSIHLTSKHDPDPDDADSRPSVLMSIAGFIIVTEFCERLAYYSFAGSLVVRKCFVRLLSCTWISALRSMLCAPFTYTCT
jgi:hypothetical protein